MNAVYQSAALIVIAMLIIGGIGVIGLGIAAMLDRDGE